MVHSSINQPFRSSLEIETALAKVKMIDASCQLAFARRLCLPEERIPGRDVKVVPIHKLPDKPGISSLEGQARLLHDLASIEMQAMELGLRTLIEFPEAPEGFRRELVEVTCEEALHLNLTLDAIERLGFQWGDWPVHLALWNAVSSNDTLLERILIVHRFLEGSGLDAGETIRQRLKGVQANLPLEITDRIFKDEIRHVLFGSTWFKNICEDSKLDSKNEFKRLVDKLQWQLPRRLEPLNRRARIEAGFTEDELEILLELQNTQRRPRAQAEVITN